MKTREDALTYGLSFPNTYQEAPFAFVGEAAPEKLLLTDGIKVLNGRVVLKKYRM